MTTLTARTEPPAVDPTWLIEAAVRQLLYGDSRNLNPPPALWTVLAYGAARGLDQLEGKEAALHQEVRRETERVRGVLEAAAALHDRDPQTFSDADRQALKAGAKLLSYDLLPRLPQL